MARSRFTFDSLRARHLAAVAGMVVAAFVSVAAIAGAIASLSLVSLELLHCVAVACLGIVMYVSFEIWAEDVAQARRLREAERQRADFWSIVDHSWNV